MSVASSTPRATGIHNKPRFSLAGYLGHAQHEELVSVRTSMDEEQRIGISVDHVLRPKFVTHQQILDLGSRLGLDYLVSGPGRI